MAPNSRTLELRPEDMAQQQQRPPSTPERLALLEQRQDALENTIMSAIRDLAMNVNQMHRTQLEALRNGLHDHHHHEQRRPELMFTFLEQLSLNSMYRVYQDAADHPICPNQLNIHTRREGTDLFDSEPVDPALVALLSEAFVTQVGHVANKVYYVEVHSLSDEPLDEHSVVVGGPSE